MYGRTYDDVQPEPSTGSITCLKYLMYIINLIFLVVGAAVVAGVLYILIEKSFISAVSGNQLLTVSCWLLIIGGAIIIFILPFLGCCGAYKEYPTLLAVYAGLIVVVFLAFLVAGVLCFVLRGQIGEWIIASMEESLKDEYGVDLEDSRNQFITTQWDKAQQEMRCCAVRERSWNVYLQSNWYTEQPGNREANNKVMVPLSCCVRNQLQRYVNERKCQTYLYGPPFKRGSDQPGSGTYNEALHYRGCYEAGKDWVWDHSAWLIGIGIGVAIAMIIAMIVAFAMYATVRRQKSTATNYGMQTKY